MKYLRMFDNVVERAAALRENDEISIVSYTKSNQVVDIKMPVDPLEAPFWIDNLSDDPNTVTISKSYWSNAESVYIEKSANMKRWVEAGTSGISGGTKITIAPQSRIYLRFSLDGGKISSLSGYMSEGIGYKISANHIDASKPYAIGGNILSLLNGPLYVPGERLFNSQQIGGSMKDDQQIGTYAELFKDSTTLVDASKLILPNNLTTYNCYYNMFGGCTSLTKAPALPATTMTSGAYDNMFNGCVSLSIMPNLACNTIPANLFNGCVGLTSIEIPANVTSIGANAFNGCTGVNSIEVPSTVTSIGSNAFLNVLDINYNGSATGSPWGALCVNGYVDGNLVYTDNTKTTLVACAKASTSVTIPDSVTAISENAFKGCTGLASITVPDTVVTIGSNAFYNIPNITYHGEATGSPWGALCVNGYVDGVFIYADNTKTTLVGCDKTVTSAVIPGTVTTIGANAFKGCDLMTTVTVPNSVTTINSYAFANCDSLYEFNIEATTPPTLANSNVFENTTNIVIVVPEGYYSTYQSASVWSQFSGKMTDGLYVIEYTSSTDGIVTPFTTITSSNTLITNIYSNGVGYFRFAKPVTNINNKAFYQKETLTSITIPDTVTSIGDQAFQGCLALASVDMSDNVATIGTSAFSGCTSLASIDIPDSVTSIGTSAFYNCSKLISVDVPSTVATIGSYAFSNIPNVNYNGSATGSPWGALCVNGYIDGDIIYSSSAKTTIVKCLTSATSVTIPNTVTTINANAFSSCTSLTSVDIPDSVTNIGQYAFSGCTGLTSVSLSNNITTINQYTFSGCTSLASVTIPDSVTSIGTSAFYNCSKLISVNVPSTVATIGSNAFYNIPNVNYNGSATGSPWGALCVNGYIDGGYIYTDNTKTTLKSYIGAPTTITIPDTVITIGDKAFYQNTQIISVTLPNTVTSIGASAFQGCTALTLINLSANLTSIGTSAFSGCTDLLGNIDIPVGVTSIGNYTFKGCSSLTNVTLPNSLTSIGTESFRDCTSLTSITLPSTLTSIGQSAFDTCSGLSGNITIPNGVTNIPSYAFYDCTGFDNITIPNTVSTIGTDAFKNVANIIYSGSATGSPWGAKSVNGYCENGFVYTNNTKTTLKKYAGNLEAVVIPSSVTSISNQAFNNNVTINSVDMPDSITSMGTEVFYNCTNLSSVNLSNSLTSIGDYAFYSAGLTSIVIPSSVTSIGNSAFYECNVLSSVTIPNSVTSIGTYAFHGCDLLKNITIPASVTSIGTYAFYNIPYASVTCKATTPPTLGSYAFIPASYGNCPTIYVPSSVVDTYKSASGWSSYSSKINPIPNGIVLSQGVNVVTVEMNGLDSGTGYYTINGGSQVPVSEGTTTVAITQAMNGQTLLAHGVFGGDTIEESLTLVWVDYAPSVTITESQNYATINAPVADVIQYRLGSSGAYTNYTEPVYIATNTTMYVIATRTVSNVGYTTNFEQEVTHDIIPPTNLTIACSSNIVTITAVNAVTIGYNFDGSSNYTTYTEPFNITQNVTLYAKASNVDGSITDSQNLTYIDYSPAVTITETNNYVTITSATADTIQYRLGSSGAYTNYTEPVYIVSDTTMYVKATRTVSGVDYVTNETQAVTHTNLPPTNLTITNNKNNITITADNATTIEYNTDGSSNYTTYTEPFAISQTVTVYAKATNADGSITGSQVCEYDTSTTPFYIEDLSGSSNTIYIAKSNKSATSLYIQKSTDGITWETMSPTSTTAITATIPANGRLYLRSGVTSWASSTSYYNFFNSAKGNFKIGGNITSLLYGSSFNGQTTFRGTESYTFLYLFKGNTKLVDASELLLPTDICSYCYYAMFYQCTNLTTAPVLPATTLAQNCYFYMFNSCTNLNYIKCLATDISAGSCTTGWVSGVAANGTFVKNASMSNWTTDANGIPSGWTVEDAAE